MDRFGQKVIMDLVWQITNNLPNLANLFPAKLSCYIHMVHKALKNHESEL